MWVSRTQWNELQHTNVKLNEELKHVQQLQHERVLGLERMNTQLTTERGWFMHRLNQVERERAMLIQDRIGVPISTPTFIPVADNKEDEALMQMPDLSTVGGDAHDNGPSDAEPGDGVDFTMMPGYNVPRRGV